MCCETRSCHALRHNDLEGHRNFSCTIYSFYILCLEHHYCGESTVAFTYLKVKSTKCLCLLPVVLVLLFWSLFRSDSLNTATSIIIIIIIIINNNNSSSSSLAISLSSSYLGCHRSTVISTQCPRSVHSVSTLCPRTNHIRDMPTLVCIEARIKTLLK